MSSDPQSATLQSHAPMPWFVRGDIDGFFGLALDNLIQLLLIHFLCKNVLAFPNDLIFQRILPGAAVSVLIGNIFYSWQARQLSKQTGRSDICALPYGINTVSIIGHVFFVMLPAKFIAIQLGATDQGVTAAWHAGLIATLGSAAIEGVGAFVAEPIRRATPRAALLSTLAGIALTFISMGFLFQTYAHPLIGLSTFAVVLLVYFGRVRFKGGIPGGLVAVVLGTSIWWISKWLMEKQPDEQFVWAGARFCAPIPVIGDLIQAFKGDYFVKYLPVIIPMGLFNVIGSLQNIESAEAAGDLYPTRPSLLVNGVGSLAAAICGSCFPTTIYIGHPGWKAMGARAGYSILNGIVLTAICLSGTLEYVAHIVPIDAGMAIVLWIGIVITAQAFQAVPREHAPAVVIGLLPGLAAWGAMLAKNSLRAAGATFSAKILTQYAPGTFMDGDFALEQGFIFASMILAAATVAVIGRKFYTAAAWCAVGGVLSLIGLMHAYQWTSGDTVIRLISASDRLPGMMWAQGYAAMAVVFLLAKWVTVEGEGH
jgi:AGZA family xanthine/uracil permease-like MFS transporter